MARKEIYTCDHCGKELNPMTDYVEFEISDFDNYTETDLCANCYDKLNEIVNNFICGKE